MLIIIVFSECYVICLRVQCNSDIVFAIECRAVLFMRSYSIFYPRLYVSISIFIIFSGGVKSCLALEDPPRNTIESVRIPLRVSLQ